MSVLPLQFSASGPVATPPATLRANLVTLVSSLVPGYTANLPASLIEDLTSTSVGALITVDQARVDAVNNVSPYGANGFVLGQIGSQLGIPEGLSTNGNANVVFEGTAGYVIPPGFLVGDGSNQYAVQDGGVIGNSGSSQPMFVIATNPNVFPIPANSITTLVTTVPSPFSLTVTNPLAGLPAQAPETTEAYRARIIQASQVTISGVQAYLKTLLMAVPGVSPRLVRVIQQGIYWEVVCGGGDPFQVAGAIYAGVSNVGLLTGSATSIRNTTVTLFDPPDSYNVIFVNPPAQTVAVAALWNTTLANFSSGPAVDQYIINAVQSYVNGISVGQPINLLVMTQGVQDAVTPVLDPLNLTTLEFTVSINGTPVSPGAGTSIIPGDPESYFTATPTSVTSSQG